jgi:hypothetical protein
MDRPCPPYPNPFQCSPRNTAMTAPAGSTHPCMIHLIQVHRHPLTCTNTPVGSGPEATLSKRMPSRMVVSDMKKRLGAW